MAAVPLIFGGVFYPKNKKDPPQAGTFIGNAFIQGLEVGGGPIEPPPDIQPEPPLEIWGGPIDPYPDHGLPPIIAPPEQPPSVVQKPHEGWNFSIIKGQWYYLHIPGEGEAQPK